MSSPLGRSNASAIAGYFLVAESAALWTGQRRGARRPTSAARCPARGLIQRNEPREHRRQCRTEGESVPATPHIERHFTGSQTMRDVVIGMADGLTVPFALAAGLSAAVSSTKLIVTAGLAEIAAGAIAMGLGGYLAARSDQEHYQSEVRREQREIRELPDREIEEVRQVLRGLGLAGEALESVTAAISAEPQRWTDFMMRFELGLERPDPKRAPLSAITIGGSYLVGGMIPLFAYILLPSVEI